MTAGEGKPENGATSGLVFKVFTSIQTQTGYRSFLFVLTIGRGGEGGGIARKKRGGTGEEDLGWEAAFERIISIMLSRSL